MRKVGTRVAIIPLLLFFFLAANLLFSPTLHAQAPFYQGKSITLIVGNQAGGLYDLWARLIANHIGKQIPGNPNVIVQNMPAAGSLTLGLPGIWLRQIICTMLPNRMGSPSAPSFRESTRTS